MTVYDKRASGFIPGEGCGFVVLKRLEDAQRDGNYIYATINGWGISSDGKGGITAPSKIGQSKKFEEANFYRIQGQVARQQARSAQISTLFSTGTSLLSMSGAFKNPAGPQAGDAIYTDY